MQNHKISVIIPVYNAEKTVGNILEKLISQNYRNIEIIAINDGSKDSSWGILQKFAKKDKRVIVINQENAGVSAARNTGLQKVSGEFITFIDSDDDISSDIISTLAENIIEKSEFILCGMTFNGIEMTAQGAQVEGVEEVTRYVLISLLTKNLLYGPYCKLFRHDIVADHMIQFPLGVKYGEDTIFVLNYLSKVKNLQVVDEALYVYQMTNTGLAASNSSVRIYRRARSEALGDFAKRSSTFKNRAIYVLVKLRWCAAYLKALYLEKRKK